MQDVGCTVRRPPRGRGGGITIDGCPAADGAGDAPRGPVGAPGLVEEVDEADYRYDGPRPQTREAAVMMLADVVESACRSLDDPAPARIEHLVRELAMNRLLDGQFDECGLTLRELNIIQTSLIKTETALLHNRVKYPDQATA